MFTLWNDINDDFFTNAWKSLYNNLAESTRQSNRMNLRDKGSELEFIVELPGVRAEDLDITIQHDTLTFQAKREIESPPEDRIYMREREAYNIRHSISLPALVDTDRTEASLKNGILKISMPKAPKFQPKKISITNQLPE